MLQSKQRGFRGAGGEGGGRQFAKPSLEGRGKYHFTSNDGDDNSKNSSQKNAGGSLPFRGNMTSWDVDAFQAGTQGLFV